MLLRLLNDFRRAMDLSLVLDQQGIPHELRGVGETSGRSVIDDAHACPAERRLPHSSWKTRPPPRREELPSLTAASVAAGVLFFLAILGLHVWTGPASAESAWFSRGSADAAGNPARRSGGAITALTLHADAGHAVGNAVLGGLLVALLARHWERESPRPSSCSPAPRVPSPPQPSCAATSFRWARPLPSSVPWACSRRSARTAAAPGYPSEPGWRCSPSWGRRSVRTSPDTSSDSPQAWSSGH